MRHGKKFNHLGRKKGHREAMLSNMAASLLTHKRIFTTTAKAKALRVYVEPLITRSKNNTTHSRRVVFGYLQSKDAVNELFTTIAPKVADRPGGYTRILKTHNRLGDNADMCMMELVDFNEAMLEAKSSKSKAKSGTKRTRRGKKTDKTATATPAAETTPVEEVTPIVEDAVVVEETTASEEAPKGEDAPKKAPKKEVKAETAKKKPAAKKKVPAKKAASKKEDKEEK
ncbi:MAG: 50S ribosomal protein L17 [Bacteroidetes bacterium]|nr:50S ribosomal protein L17 [Bacteroidota bacterium]